MNVMDEEKKRRLIKGVSRYEQYAMSIRQDSHSDVQERKRKLEHPYSQVRGSCIVHT